VTDYHPTSPDALQQEIAAMEARLAELRHLADRERIAQSGAGGLAIGGTAGGEGSVVIGGDVYGHIYHVYQSAPGRKALRQQDIERILSDYLRWVYNAYSKARLYGLESSPTARGRPVRALAEVFVHVTLRRVQPPRRIEVEERARQMQGDATRAYLRLVEEKHQEGDTVPLQRLLTLHDRVVVIGGAGSGKSTLLAYLAASLAEAALQGQRAGVDLPPGKTTLVPLLIPLRYFREYVRWCAHAPQEHVRQPRAGTLAGFIPWYLKRRNPALETSEDFFDRLLLGGGCLLMLDGLDEVVSRTDRSQVRQQVEDLVHDVYPGNQVLVTAREAGYREDAVFGDDFVRLDVQRLDNEQIRTLVGNWCVQLYPGEVEARTDELVQAIQEINDLRTDRDLPPLVSTPLLTTMVVSVKWGETELPRERAKLYEACVKVILQAQYVPDDPARQALVEWGGAWEDQRNWLATLALAMHEGGRAGAAVPEIRVREVLQGELAPTSVAQFLEAVRYRGGLLEERAELFQFVHLTFQEFLTARWLAKQRQGAWPHLQPNLTDAWWREVFLLTYGFAQMDHPPFAREYLEWLSTQTGDGTHRLAGLELAGAALLELERPDPEVRRHQAERLLRVLRDPTVRAPGSQRVRAGDTLARLGDPRFRADAWYLPDEPLLGFVEIPAGAFWMGSKQRDRVANNDEKPRHRVTLSRYYIARYPVTVAQFRAFVEASGHRPADEQSLEGLPTHPVVDVNWYDALAYCDWLTVRLRTWEHRQSL
jgi:Sulfatase-modifying factor enzyme 1/NACHT domain